MQPWESDAQTLTAEEFDAEVRSKQQVLTSKGASKSVAPWEADSEPVDDIGLQRAATQETMKDIARARMGLPSVNNQHVPPAWFPNVTAWGQGLGSSVVAPIARVLGADERADYLQMWGAAYRQAASERDKAKNKIVPPIISRGLRGAAESVPTMILAGRAAGPYGALGFAGALEADKAITEGRLAGLEGGELAAYAGAQGMIEAGVGAVFQKFGFGGAESIAAAKPVVRQALGDTLKKLGIATLQELPEEIATEIGHNVTSALAGVDPNATSPEAIQQTIADTTVQTLLTLGAIGSPQVVSDVATGRARANRLAELRAIRAKGYVSADDGQTAGIEGETRKERLASADAEIQQLEQEIQDAAQVPEDESVAEEAGQVEVPAEPAGEVAPEQSEILTSQELLDWLAQAEAAAPEAAQQPPVEQPPVEEPVASPVAEEVAAEPPRQESPWESETRAKFAGVPAFEGATFEFDEPNRTVKVARPDGRTTTVHLAADAEIAPLAKKRGLKRGANGLYVFKRGGQKSELIAGDIYLRSDAGHRTINHEVIHWLEDEGIITPEEVSQLGGREGIASKYGEWAESKQRAPNSVFERIYDFLERIFSSQRRLFEDIGKRQSPQEQSSAQPEPVREAVPTVPEAKPAPAAAKEVVPEAAQGEAQRPPKPKELSPAWDKKLNAWVSKTHANQVWDDKANGWRMKTPEEGFAATPTKRSGRKDQPLADVLDPTAVAKNAAEQAAEKGDYYVVPFTNQAKRFETQKALREAGLEPVPEKLNYWRPKLDQPEAKAEPAKTTKEMQQELQQKVQAIDAELEARKKTLGSQKSKLQKSRKKSKNQELAALEQQWTEAQAKASQQRQELFAAHRESLKSASDYGTRQESQAAQLKNIRETQKQQDAESAAKAEMESSEAIAKAGGYAKVKAGLEAEIRNLRGRKKRTGEANQWKIDSQIERRTRDLEKLEKFAPKTKLQEAADTATKEAFDELDAFGKMLKGKGLGMNPQFDPEVIAGAARVVAKFAKAGTLKFAAVIEHLAKSIGQAAVNRIRPALEAEWDRLQGSGTVKGMEPRVSKPSGTTGTKNVKTDELRQKAGMEERPPVEPETRDEWDSAAAKRIADDPQYAGKLAAELSAKPRALDPVEEMTLNRHLRDLENRRQSGEDVADEMATAVEASERAGTIWGRAGVSRQAERAADFSLEGIIRQHVRSVNEKPSAEQTAKYAEMTDRITKLEGELNEERQKRIQAEIDTQIAGSKKVEPAKRPKKTTERRQAAEKKVADAWENFRKAMTTTAGSSGANLIGPAVEVATAYVELGYVKFSEFIAEVRTNMKDADESLFRKAWVQAQPKIEPENRDASAIGKLARDLTRWAVESGITEREAVIDTVHEDLTDMGFELSRSDTMSAMSGYGDFRELSKDEVSVKIRGIKGEIQQLRKLEDMQAGQAPKKTGVERREPTDEERRLIKEVNEAKKRGGYTVTDPDTQLKSALASAKTAARNRIADLEKAIAAREKIVSGQTALKPDAELTDLRKRRDALNEEYRKIFPPKKNGLSDARRLQMAEKLLDRQLADLKADLEARRYDPKEKKAALTSPEIESKRKELKELRERMTAARQAASGAELAEWEGEGGAAAGQKRKKPLTDAQRLKIREASLERQIEELQADLAAGRLTPKPKAAPLSSPEIEAMQLQLSQLKEVREQARAASPEYQAQEAAKQNARYKKTLERSLAFWGKRRDDAVAGKLPAKRKPTPVDDAILEKKYQIEQVKRHARAEIEEAERAARGRVGKALGFGGDLLDLSRAVMTGYEMSAVLRQGAFYTLGFPKQAFPAVWKSIQAAFSRRADFALHDDLMKRPNHADYVRGGLETTASDGPLSQREELLRSRISSWLAKQEGIAAALPRWAAEGLLGSERAFRSFLNTMRADLFDYMKDSVEASRPGTWSEEDAKTVAHGSNVFSGRGRLPFNQSGVGWSRVFYAPRWVWSRGQLLVGEPLWKGDKATRLAIGKVYVRAALGFGAYALLRHAVYAALADDDEHEPEYELDPRSSDFGKMRAGETRIDSGAGFNQLVTLAARIITGEAKRASGKIVPIRGDDVPYGGDDTGDVVHRFLDTKLAPLPSAVMDFIRGKNVVGEKATVGKVVGDRVTPMTWRDIWDAEKELNVPQGTVAALEAFFGAGVSTYGSRNEYRDSSEAERKETITKDLKNVSWDSTGPAYGEFLTDKQLKQFDARRREKRGLVIYNATYTGKDEDELKTRDKNRKYLTEMGVSFEEARDLLKDYYRRPDEKGRPGRITEGYFPKLRALKRIYER